MVFISGGSDEKVLFPSLVVLLFPYLVIYHHPGGSYEKVLFPSQVVLWKLFPYLVCFHLWWL